MQFHIERKKENSDDDRQTTNVVPTEVPTEVPTKTAKRIKVPMAPALLPIAVAAKAEHRHFHLMMYINHSQNFKPKVPLTKIEIGKKLTLRMNISRNDSGHQREGERK
jgi:hypothetical protein